MYINKMVILFQNKECFGPSISFDFVDETTNK